MGREEMIKEIIESKYVGEEPMTLEILLSLLDDDILEMVYDCLDIRTDSTKINGTSVFL